MLLEQLMKESPNHWGSSSGQKLAWIVEQVIIFFLNGWIAEYEWMDN